jgi:DNA ligase D-like protein (predicted ligase)
MPAAIRARFVEPMLLLRTSALPNDGARWEYQLKLDGYRAIAFKSDGRIHLRSRNDKDFNGRYPGVVKGLAGLPDETTVDGEIVALDAEGRPSFQALQNLGSPAGQSEGASAALIVYFVFDVMVLRGRDVMARTLEERRTLLEDQVLPALTEPVRYNGPLDANLRDLITSVRELGLEGVVAKRRGSRYEPGQRSGAWLKQRINRGQEFVIGGYTIGGKTFDAVIVGYYEGDHLMYAARTRNGFTPLMREQLFRRFRGLEIETCPFANLPEEKSGRWGQGLTKAKMAQCRWLRPVLVGQFEFLEWTGERHLRHTSFTALRDDKAARDVRRE